MLYFKTNTGACIEWHVGEAVSKIFQPNRVEEYWPNGDEKQFPDVNYVVEVYADGHELAYVLDNIRGLPFHTHRTVWFGEMARFIHANL